jgi:hypothetical protein
MSKHLGEKHTEKAPAGGQRYELRIQRRPQDAGATREKANCGKERAHMGGKDWRSCCSVLLAQAGMPVLLKGKCEKQMRRPEASGTNCEFKDARRMPALRGINQMAEGKAKIPSGRYVYDRGGAELSCECARSDYDVRSLRCTLACLGCVLEAG